MNINSFKPKRVVNRYMLSSCKAVCILILFAGLSSSDPLNDRVVGGEDAAEGEFPFMVSLRSSRGTHACGATIVSESWILTAAHCVAQRNPAAVSIQYGSARINKTGPNVVQVSEIIVHEDFDRYNYYLNDIAVLRLQSPLKVSETVQPVKLPKDFLELPGQTRATLVGWGFEKSGGTIQNNLQKIDLLTYTNDECSSIHFNPVFATNICAGVPEGGKGQCTGDSGGPLIVDGVQVGAVSWSVKPCAGAPFPGVYTKISHYISWIRLKTGIP